MTAVAAPLSDGEIEVVSWDVDGTLYDLRRLVGAVAGLYLRGVFTPRVAANVAEWRRLDAFRTAMDAVRARGGALQPGDLPADRAELLALEERWYGPALAGIGPRAEALAWIEHFARAGVRQVVVSDYRCEYKLDRLGLAGRFERVYAGEVEGHLKPSPGLFAAVLADLGVDPARVLHIGDKADRDGASAAPHGCRVYILDPGLPAPPTGPERRRDG